MKKIKDFKTKYVNELKEGDIIVKKDGTKWEVSFIRKTPYGYQVRINSKESPIKTEEIMYDYRDMIFTDSLKKYKIGKYIVDAKDPVHATEIVKMIDSRWKDSLSESDKQIIDDVLSTIKHKTIAEVIRQLNIQFAGFVGSNYSLIIEYLKQKGIKDPIKDEIVRPDQQFEFKKQYNQRRGLSQDIFYFDNIYAVDRKTQGTIPGARLGMDRTRLEQALDKYFHLSARDSIKDSNVDYSYLNEEEQKAVDDYRKSIQETQNPEVLRIFSHILQEELDHIEELKQAKEIDDSIKDEYVRSPRGTFELIEGKTREDLEKEGYGMHHYFEYNGKEYWCMVKNNQAVAVRV